MYLPILLPSYEGSGKLMVRASTAVGLSPAEKSGVKTDVFCGPTPAGQSPQHRVTYNSSGLEWKSKVWSDPLSLRRLREVNHNDSGFI